MKSQVNHSQGGMAGRIHEADDLHKIVDTEAMQTIITKNHTIMAITVTEAMETTRTNSRTIMAKIHETHRKRIIKNMQFFVKYVQREARMQQSVETGMTKIMLRRKHHMHAFAAMNINVNEVPKF